VASIFYACAFSFMAQESWSVWSSW
jgi:hypothetical protein